MLTYKLKIENCDNKKLIAKMQQDYSYAFRKLYKHYNNINDWNDKFIGALYKLPNCYINMPIELFDKLKIKSVENNKVYYLQNNTSSHLNKKNKTKQEYIIRLN